MNQLEWVSSLLVVKNKVGSLRVCLDPNNLNETILRENYRIPTRNDIVASGC